MYHVPLVPRDANREETIFRIKQSLQKLVSVSDEIFDKVEHRITKIREKAENIDKRTEILEKKLETLHASSNVIVFNLPRQLPPSTSSEPSESLFHVNTDSEHFADSDDVPQFRRADDDKLRPLVPIDFTRELQKPDKFFLTSQVIREYDQKYWEKYKKRLLGGLREMPNDVSDIAELFYVGTSIPAYEGVTGEFRKYQLDSEDGATSSRKANDEIAQMRIHEQLLEDTALTTIQNLEENLEDDHPLAFKLETNIGKEDSVHLPESLPNLKGYAQDFTLQDLGIDVDLLPDLSEDVPAEIPEVTAEDVNKKAPEGPPPPQPAQILVQKTSEITTTTTTVTASEIPDSPPKIPQAPPILPSILSPIPPPPPPPPPAPPPSALGSALATSSDGRADLMAAIRAAGGAGKAKLSKLSESRRGKFEGILETSALGGTTTTPSKNPSMTPSGGGDLMSALSKALDARRKAISGKTEKSKNSPSASIPAPPNFTDDDWD